MPGFKLQSSQLSWPVSPVSWPLSLVLLLVPATLAPLTQCKAAPSSAQLPLLFLIQGKALCWVPLWYTCGLCFYSFSHVQSTGCTMNKSKHILAQLTHAYHLNKTYLPQTIAPGLRLLLTLMGSLCCPGRCIPQPASLQKLLSLQAAELGLCAWESQLLAITCLPLHQA